MARSRRLLFRSLIVAAVLVAAVLLVSARLGLGVYERSWCQQIEQAFSRPRIPIAGDVATSLVPLRTLLREQGTKSTKGARLEVDKSDRLMRLVIDGRTVKTYVISLGTNPDGKRIRRGDCATPEGDYYICEKNPRSQFYLSLKLAYPNLHDARRGLRDGIINRRTYSAIERAIRRGRTPPMNTALGGDICLHGGGAGYLDKTTDPPVIEVYDWTQGCIALDNPAMKELFNLLPVGTKVHIAP